MDLFDQIAREQERADKPLADLIRPDSLDGFVGQPHLVGEGKPLRLLMQNQRPISMILWGPPGVGKTTLAAIYANACDAEFIRISAVASGVADVRKVIEKARANKSAGRQTILFIDEIHRFNKAQQDALLHSVEDGTVVLIGATTENPSFEVISPLLSRCRVFTLQLLSEAELRELLQRALKFLPEKLGAPVQVQEQAGDLLIAFANGDGRELVNGLELAGLLTQPGAKGQIDISAAAVALAFQRKSPKYDKGADAHYDTISAFIKSIRGSDPDAAVHYLARMLDAGEEPRFIARRLIILASEDIGNADPQALILATSAFGAVHSIGMPEAQIVLSQAATYLASAPKSNASYKAIAAAMQDVQNKPVQPVPLHLRNAPTALMAQQGYAKDYRYPHDFPDAFVPETYLPEGLQDRTYYRPTRHGAERTIAERLQKLWPKRYGRENKDDHS